MGKGDTRRPAAKKGAYEDNYDKIFGEGAFYRDDASTQQANIDAISNLEEAKDAFPDSVAKPGTPADRPALEGEDAPEDLTD